ncbi:MAG: OmpP1/FadL family transporter [Bdellovibrionota bacterium]
MTIYKSCLILAAVLFSANAHAAGFEKAVMWSGKYAGAAGAGAVGGVAGSQSLYFNPAGLAAAGDVSLNYSPTWINVDGSMVTSTRVDQSRPGVLPFGGGFASYGSGHWGFGMGAYLAGGEKAIFPDLDLTPIAKPFTTYTPTLETDLMIVEYSIGGACEVMPGLKFGAAWRISKATGTLSSILENTANTAFSHLVIRDAKDTRYNGFRLGAMFEDQANRAWGVGASYRSKVTFDAAGTGSGDTIVIPAPVNSVTAQTVADTRVGLTLPAAYSVGGHFAVNDSFKLLAGADYIKYSVDDQIYIIGTANGVTIPNIPLNWSDEWNWRLGVEYSGIHALTLRAGYVRTSQVTNTTDAKATIPPPGPGNTFTVGAGYSLMSNLELDGAFEYAHEEGDGSMTMPTSGLKELLAGVTTTTKATAYGVHTGITYRF